MHSNPLPAQPPALSHLANRVLEFIASSVSGPRKSHPGKETFESLALELFAAQFEANVPYQAICRARGWTPTTVKTWSQIPAVPTEAFKEFEITCLTPEQRTIVFHSSGTTQQRPGRNHHSPDSLALYHASLIPWFRHKFLAEPDSREIGPNSRRLFAALTPPAGDAPHSSLASMFDSVTREFGRPSSRFFGRPISSGSWDLDFEPLVSWLQDASTGGDPVAILGTAFGFVHLADHLERLGLTFSLPAGSRALETGGYKGRSRELPKVELHALIQRSLGLPGHEIFCEYGMCELASQAYDAPSTGDRRFEFPPWVRVVAVSPESGQALPAGQAGLLQVCDLANVWSTVRIQTGDLGIPFPDGRIELLGRLPVAELRGCSLLATETEHRA